MERGPSDMRIVPALSKKEMKSKLVSLRQQTPTEQLDAAVKSILPPGEPSFLPIHYEDTVAPPVKRDLGVQVLETKKLSPLPIVKTEAGVTNLEIKPASTTKQILGSSITFQSGPSKPQTIKLLPSNQFIQLKPQPVTSISQTQGTKIVTLKSAPSQMKTGTMMASNTNIIKGPPTLTASSKIYTLKSSGLSGQQQLVPLEKSNFSHVANSSTGQMNFSPTKFTIMKQGTGGHTSDSSTLSAESSPSNSDYSILDLPVLFADNDGNIQQGQETHTMQPSKATMVTQQMQQHTTIVTTSTASSGGSGIQHTFQPRPTQYIIQTKPTMQGKDVKTIGGKNFVIGNVSNMSTGIKTTTGKPGNIVVLSKNAVRPISSIVTKTPGGVNQGQQVTHLKYAKLVMTPQAGSPRMIGTAGTTIQTQSSPMTMAAGKRIEILNSSIIRPGGSVGGDANKFTPIIINVDPSKAGQSFKTFIKKPDSVPQTQIVQIGPKPMMTTTTSGGNYVLKTSIPQFLKQMTTTTTTSAAMPQAIKTKPTIINRSNLTVKRVVNVLPPKPYPSQSQDNSH